MIKNWTKGHTKGLIFGILTPILFIPLILLLLSWVQNYEFSRLWREFDLMTKYRIKIITLSIISNLVWFYYFLNRKEYTTAYGVIFGSLAFAPYIIYIKFF